MESVEILVGSPNFSEYIIRNKDDTTKREGEIIEIGQKRVQKLPEIYKGKYGVYFLILRDENFAIYQKDKPANCYEVFQIKKIDGKKAAQSFNKRFNMNYNIDEVPDIKEKYPVDEYFGRIAWTYPTVEKAKEKFYFLVEEYREKEKDKENV